MHMLLIESLPIELNYKIFEYYNWYEKEHRLIYQHTINEISKLPIFLRKIKQRTRRGYIHYLNFESENGIHYIIEGKNYFQTLKSAIRCFASTQRIF